MTLTKNGGSKCTTLIQRKIMILKTGYSHLPGLVKELSEGKIPTGLIYNGARNSLETNTLTTKEPVALQDLSFENNRSRYEALLKDFR